MSVIHGVGTRLMSVFEGLRVSADAALNGTGIYDGTTSWRRSPNTEGFLDPDLAAQRIMMNNIYTDRLHLNDPLTSITAPDDTEYQLISRAPLPISIPDLRPVPRRHPVSLEMWQRHLDHDGRVTVAEKLQTSIYNGVNGYLFCFTRAMYVWLFIILATALDQLILMKWIMFYSIFGHLYVCQHLTILPPILKIFGASNLIFALICPCITCLSLNDHCQDSFIHLKIPFESISRRITFEFHPHFLLKSRVCCFYYIECPLNPTMSHFCAKPNSSFILNVPISWSHGNSLSLRECPSRDGVILIVGKKSNSIYLLNAF